MKRALLIGCGSVAGLATVLAIHPPQIISKGDSGSLATGGLSGGTLTTGGLTSNTSATKNTPATKNTSATKNGSFTGNVSWTQYGPVQVKITVANGKITNATGVQLPNNDFRSQQISSQAEPYLIQETIAAQSASIQGVGGASYTSQGWSESLASAIAKAGI